MPDDFRPNSHRALRTKVAACTQLLVRHGLMGYSGHVSARLPDRADAFFIQSVEQPRSGLAPDHLLTVDLDGRVVDGPDGLKPPSEVALHCEILRARPDIQAIAHFHHDRTNVFTLVEDQPLRIVKNHAVRWRDGVPVHPDPAHVAGAALGRAAAATLGLHHAMQIRAHGQVITAESVEAALVDAIHFVENAEALYAACAIGRVKPLTEVEMASFEAHFRRDMHVRKLWRFYTETAQNEGALPRDWSL